MKVEKHDGEKLYGPSGNKLGSQVVQKVLTRVFLPMRMRVSAKL